MVVTIIAINKFLFSAKGSDTVMKNLIFINGTMGVGKTTTSIELNKLLPKSVFLDGDWCWYMNPFVVSEETKAMVITNITCMLNTFIRCSEFENIVFCWVMHQESILEDITSKLKISDYHLYKFTLVCSQQALINRIKYDIDSNKREFDVIERALARAECFSKMDTIHIDVTEISATQAAKEMLSIIGGQVD